MPRKNPYEYGGRFKAVSVFPLRPDKYTTRVGTG